MSNLGSDILHMLLFQYQDFPDFPLNNSRVAENLSAQILYWRFPVLNTLYSDLEEVGILGCWILMNILINLQHVSDFKAA